MKNNATYNRWCSAYERVSSPYCTATDVKEWKNTKSELLARSKSLIKNTKIPKLLNRKNFNIFVSDWFNGDWCNLFKILLKRDINGLIVAGANVREICTEKHICKFNSALERERSVNTGKHVNLNAGFVYLLSNPAFPGWVKMGSTVNVNERVSSYQTSDPLRSFVIEKKWFVFNRKSVEKSLINIASTSGYRVNNEWAQIDAASLINLAQTKLNLP
jgi:hypothetical protein